MRAQGPPLSSQHVSPLPAAEACSTTEDGAEPLLCPSGYECHILSPGDMAEGIPNRGQCVKQRRPAGECGHRSLTPHFWNPAREPVLQETSGAGGWQCPPPLPPLPSLSPFSFLIRPGHRQTPLCRLLLADLGVSCFISLSLSFLLCKMGPLHTGLWRFVEIRHVKPEQRQR